MTDRPAGMVALLCASGLLGLAWLAAAHPGPPVYDGIILTEPYRYLQPPKGAEQTPPPTSARLLIPVTAGQSPVTAVSTHETPPQARIVLLSNALRIPSGVTSITLTVNPVPSPAQPPDGFIDGNVYQFKAVGNNDRPVAPGKGRMSIELRGTGISGTPHVEYFDGSRWVRLLTGQYLGENIYFAHITSTGDYALVLPGKPPASSGTSIVPFLIIGGVVLLLLGVGLLLVRLARQRAPAEP